MRKMITVKINGEERQYPQGATYEDVANDYQQEYENLIAPGSQRRQDQRIVQETDKGLRGYLFYLEG